MPEPVAPASPTQSAPTAPAAPVQAEPVQRASDIDIEKLSPGSPEYQDWRMGKLPKSEKTSAVKEGESATPEVQETTDTADSVTATAPTSRKPNLKTPADSENRFNEILEERGRLKQQLETLQEQLRKVSEPAKPASEPAEPIEVPAPRIDDLTDNGEPRFKTIAEWQDAVRAFDREQILKEVESRQAKTQEEQRRARVDKTINDGWKTRVAEAAKKYSDYDAVALNKDLKIPSGSLLENFLLDSEHGAHVLYELGKNPGELERISRIQNPQRQFRALLDIEAKFSAAPAAPAPKKITAVTAIPHEIGGSGTVLPDESEQAAIDAETDPQAVRRYIEAENRRALAKRKR
jgi:hypothetical protein